MNYVKIKKRLKMKKYISAVLIPCLFIQFFGCYSQKFLTYEDLNSVNTDEINIIINDSINYTFKKNVTDEEIVMHSDKKYCVNADTSDGCLILYNKSIRKTSNKSLSLVMDTLKIKESDVRSIQKTEMDFANTTLLTLGIIVSAALIVGLIVGLSSPLFN
jgi:hypothetical protein